LKRRSVFAERSVPMPVNAARRPAALLLIAVPLLFTASFTALGFAFDYPGILRAPTDEILRRFAAGGPGLIALWYTFMLSAALFIPAAILFGRALQHEDLTLLTLATPLATIAGLVQVLGLIRWPILVPALVEQYFDPATDSATRSAIAVTFHAFHQYAGVAVGEQLGYLFTAAWTLVIGVALTRSSLYRPWFGALGIITALAIAVGLLEPAGIAIAGTINALGYLAWSFWLIIAGIILLRSTSRRSVA
jgi:hypothetical protein